MPVPTSAIRFLAEAFATRPEPAAATAVTPTPAFAAWSMKSLRVISFFIFISPENVEQFLDLLACLSDAFCANDRASAIAATLWISTNQRRRPPQTLNVRSHLKDHRSVMDNPYRSDLFEIAFN